MNKFKTIILITIAIFALTSCGTVKNELGFGDKAGLTYNKLSVSEKDIDADLKQLETNKTFTDQFSDPSQPFLVKGKLSPDIKATWVNIQLQILAIKEARIAAKLKITDADKKTAEKNAKSFFASGDEKADKKIWDGFSKSFKDRLISGLSQEAAFSRGLETPSDKEIKAFYEKSCPNKLEVSHILVATEAEAKAIKSELDADPGKFEAIAKEKSTDTGSGAQGGDLGCLVDGAFVKEFENGAKTLTPGQISNPVKTEFGYHIIEVSKLSPVSDKKDQIIEAMKKDTSEQAFQKVTEGTKDAKIKVSKKYGKVQKDEKDVPVSTIPNAVQDTVPNT